MSLFESAFANIFISHIPGLIIVGKLGILFRWIANSTANVSIVSEWVDLTLIVVCGMVKSEVVDNKLTFVLVEGVIVIDVGLCTVCPVIVVNWEVVNFVNVGLVELK